MIRPIELNYPSDSNELFESIRHLPWPLLLHSSSHNQGLGRYDILTANPRLRITSEGNRMNLLNSEKELIKSEEAANPFNFIRTVFEHWREDLEFSLDKLSGLDADNLPPLPGIYGYFSYDLSRRIEKLPNMAQQDIPTAEMAVGFYDTIIVVDHQLKRCQVLSTLPDDEALARLNLNSPTASTETESFSLLQKFQPDIEKAQYLKAYQKVEQYIQAGDCYQINLAQRFHTKFSGSPWLAYKTLSEKAPAPYSGFFQTDELTLVSLSPEQFIGVTNNEAQTKPIKGTIKRSSKPEKDTLNLYTLRNSAKDQAENLMIVDLLRNDFSKTCRPNSVRVEKLFDIESFSNVHHLVSTICGDLKDEYDALDLFEHCFPGGSITGAPKIRAMEIIDELEPTRRSVYCGSLGYWDLAGRLDTSILIRSFLFQEDNLYCWAGGGIVADSTPTSEYQETLDKVSTFLKVLETL